MSLDRDSSRIDPNDDAMLESALKRHFNDSLNPQLGRAVSAFESHVAAHPRSVASGSSLIRRDRAWWAWAVSTTAVAASIAVAFAVMTINSQRPTPTRTLGHNISPSSVPTMLAITQPTPDEPVERTVWWRTVDQGTVYADDKTPMRKLLRQQVEELKFR